MGGGGFIVTHTFINSRIRQFGIIWENVYFSKKNSGGGFGESGGAAAVSLKYTYNRGKYLYTTVSVNKILFKGNDNKGTHDN